MSASAKKKLRKEESAAQLTEKQLKEQKETCSLSASLSTAPVCLVPATPYIFLTLEMPREPFTACSSFTAAK